MASCVHFIYKLHNNVYVFTLKVPAYPKAVALIRALTRCRTGSPWGHVPAPILTGFVFTECWRVPGGGQKRVTQATENTEARVQAPCGCPSALGSAQVNRAQVNTHHNGRFPSSSNILSAFLT